MSTTITDRDVAMGAACRNNEVTHRYYVLTFEFDVPSPTTRMTMTPAELLQGTATDFFTHAERNAVITASNIKNGKRYLTCLVRKKEVSAKPEEIVRQLWLQRLTQHYGCPVARLAANKTQEMVIKKRSKNLLEAAKRAVEIAIENSEEAAMLLFRTIYARR